MKNGGSFDFPPHLNVNSDVSVTDSRYYGESAGTTVHGHGTSQVEGSAKSFHVYDDTHVDVHSSMLVLNDRSRGAANGCDVEMYGNSKALVLQESAVFVHEDAEVWVDNSEAYVSGGTVHVFPDGQARVEGNAKDHRVVVYGDENEHMDERDMEGFERLSLDRWKVDKTTLTFFRG